MSMKVQSIAARGDHKNERVVLKASRDIELGQYVLASSTFVADNSIVAELRHPMWFATKRIKAGDLVVVYSRSGEVTLRESPLSGCPSAWRT